MIHIIWNFLIHCNPKMQQNKICSFLGKNIISFKRVYIFYKYAESGKQYNDSNISEASSKVCGGRYRSVCGTMTPTCVYISVSDYLRVIYTYVHILNVFSPLCLFFSLILAKLKCPRVCSQLFSSEFPN